MLILAKTLAKSNSISKQSMIRRLGKGEDGKIIAAQNNQG